MQIIDPLTIEDFEKDSVLVVSKVEIDSDGLGDFRELPDIKTYNISINEENRTAKFCSYSFGITCLNTNDRYNPLNLGSSYYNWLKQGRKIKLWAGVAERDPFQLILGRIDNFKLNKRAGEDVCTITGRCLMRMVLDFKLYSPNTYWGTSHIFSTVANKIRYDMEADCKGVYRVFLDSTPPDYDGSHLEEIYENTDWSCDWHSVPKQLVFTPRRVPDFTGTNNLKVYYFQVQDVDVVVSKILLAAGIFADDTARTAWLASAYCEATSKTIERVWFEPGTRGLKAITLLSEVVRYRFRFDYAGNPIFKSKPTAGSLVNTLSDYETKIENMEENVEETFTHIIVIGEERDRVEGDDETVPAVPSNLALTTGFGEETQAGLAYIKATWDANTEGDFGHYELRIKKNADSDYSEVSTIATSYMFLGLEPGVTYNVQIRSCDIYENRSAWSTAENQVTATDAGTPAKIAGETATAIPAGIKVEWTKGSEDNIAYYLIERQESPDNVDWSGAWTERVRIDGDLWLDLLLTYSKWYRYRITAYTVAEVAGVTSDFTTAVQPAQIGEGDIAANAVTASKIYVTDLAAINADMGHITAGDLTLDSNGYIKTVGKDSYVDTTAGFWLGYEAGAYKLNIGSSTEYLKWTGSALDIKGSITLINTIPNAKVDGLGDLALEDSVAYGDITGTKPPSNADVTLTAIQGELSLAGGGLVLASAGAKIRGGQTSYGVGTGFWLGDVSGVSKLSIGSSTNWLKWTGSALEIKGRLSVGANTNEDIYFEDSGIRFYDALGMGLVFAKAGLESGFILLNASAVAFGGLSIPRIEFYDDNKIILNAISNALTFYSTGKLRFPTLSSAPSGGAEGDVAVCNLGILHDYYDGTWVRLTGNAGW